MKQLISFWALPVLILMLACDAPPVDVDCSDSGAVEGGSTAAPVVFLEEQSTLQVLTDAGNLDTSLVENYLNLTAYRGDVHIQGVATHTTGLAIHEVLVGGIPASKTGFNYSRWDVIVPANQMIKALGGKTAGDIKLEITARDSCGVVHKLEPVTVGYSNASVEVTDLKLSVNFPNDMTLEGGENYLPAKSTFAATVKITANSGAMDSLVALKTSIGKLTGLDEPGSSNSVILQLGGDPQADATALVLFSSDTPGTALITATSQTKTTSTTVVVVGPPSVVPGTGTTIAAGQSLGVTVLSQANKSSVTCQASAGEGVTIMSGDTDVAKKPGGSDTNGDGYVDMTIAVAAKLAEATEVTVTCYDAYQQTASVTYTALAGEQTDPGDDGGDVDAPDGDGGDDGF